MTPDLPVPGDEAERTVLDVLRELKSSSLVELTSYFPGQDERVSDAVERLLEAELVRVKRTDGPRLDDIVTIRESALRDPGRSR